MGRLDPPHLSDEARGLGSILCPVQRPCEPWFCHLLMGRFGQVPQPLGRMLVLCPVTSQLRLKQPRPWGHSELQLLMDSWARAVLWSSSGGPEEEAAPVGFEP